jgi:hypothetical protein
MRSLTLRGYAVLLTSFCLLNEIAAFSCPAQSVGTLLNSRSRLNTELYRADPKMGYVPDGLTNEQYAKIKKQDLDKQKKMNFGAWGPRFARTDRPDGDWMVMSSLWTGGFSSNTKYSSKSISKANSNIDGLVGGLKRYAPMYAFALFMIEMVATTVHANDTKMASSLLAMAFYQITKRATVALISLNAVVKLTCIKMIGAGLLLKPLSMLIENCNRRRLWSPRRTMTYGSLLSVSGLLMTILIRNVFTIAI